MQKYNNNILIPVHQSFNTQKAVAEAMKRAKPWQTSIHLVCLMRSWNPFIMIHPASAFEQTLHNDLDVYLKALLNLMHWKELIEKNYPGVTVRVHIKKGFSEFIARPVNLVRQTRNRITALPKLYAIFTTYQILN